MAGDVSMADGTAAPAIPTPRSQVSAIARWPDALLLLLFRCCKDQLDEVFAPTPVILPLSQTCHEWRRVALANPLLWTPIYLRLDQLEMGLAFIDRAGKGRAIAVHISAQAVKAPEKDFSRLSKTLSRVVPTEVTIQEYSHRRMALLIYSLFWKGQTSLNKLSLKQWSQKSLKTEKIAPLANIFGTISLPRLKELKIWKCPVTWVNFEAAGLTLLDIRRVSKDFFPAWHGFTSVVKSAPRLKNLILIDVEFDIPCAPYPFLKMPFLESLTIRLYNGEEIHGVNPSFLKGMQLAPKLSTLVIGDVSELGQFVEGVFNSESEVKFPVLTSLTLLYTNITTPVSEKFFDATKKLKSVLLVKSQGGYEELFGKVLADDVWPELEKITVLKQSEEERTISELVEKRKAGGKDIKFLQIEEDFLSIEVNQGYQGGFCAERPDDLLRVT